MFNWKEYYRLAERLTERDVKLKEFSREACLRSAIGRAYYFLFNTAKKYATNGKLSPKFKLTGSAQDHGELAQYFKKKNDANLEKVGRVLSRTRRWREKCDYENKFPKLEQRTKKALRDIKKACENLRQGLK